MTDDVIGVGIAGFWHVHAPDYARNATEHPATRVVAGWDSDDSLAADGQRAAVILWTDDVISGYEMLISLGATPVKPPEPWLDRLLIAWAQDPDGHLVQVVQATP